VYLTTASESGYSSSRRDLLRGIGLGVAAACLSPLTASVARAQSSLTVVDVGPNLKAIGGAGGNIVVLATSAGQVVVDSGTASASDAVVAKLRELAGGGAGKVAALVHDHRARQDTPTPARRLVRADFR
jgi:hypothetical protein